jgi:putative transposase
VTIAGITTNPNEAFMAQVARKLTDSASGFLRSHQVLICDRDTKFTARFRNTLQASGVRVVFTPIMAPNCNAYAERFVLSIKPECLNRMIFFGERLGGLLRHYRRAA